MMTRLIAVDVLANHPGNILDIGVALRIDLGVEHSIEFIDQLLIAAKQLDQPGLILRLIPRILPRVPFRESTLRARLRRIKRLTKTSICFLRSYKSRLRIENLAPVLSTFFESLRYIGATKLARHTCNRPVVVSVFHRL